jgi:glycosyltransferase involved in cell wall biosynthesis
MKVSVLIPTRERLSMLKECVASARAQTHGDLEILVSNDGRDDETPRFVRDQSEVDARVRLLPRNPKPGLFSNFNHLLSHARGDAFIFVCDDDKLLPTSVERLQAVLTARPNVVAACAEFWFCDVEGNRLEDVSRRHVEDALRVGLEEGIWLGVLKQAMIAKINVGCALFRSSVLGNERFDLRSMTAADIDFWIRTAQKGPVYYLPERLSELRIHPQTASAGRIEPIAEGIIYTMEKHENAAPELEADRLRVLQIFRAAYAWRVEDRRLARKTAFDYLRDAPRFFDLADVAAVVAAALLTVVPRPVGLGIRRAVTELKRRFRSQASRSDTGG